MQVTTAQFNSLVLNIATALVEGNITIIDQQVDGEALANPVAQTKSGKGRTKADQCPKHLIWMSAEGVCKRCNEVAEDDVVTTAADIEALIVVDGMTTIEPKAVINVAKPAKKAAPKASTAQAAVAATAGRADFEIVVTGNGHLAATQRDNRIVQLLDALGVEASTESTFREVLNGVLAFNRTARANGGKVIFLQAVNPKGQSYSKTQSKALASK